MRCGAATTAFVRSPGFILAAFLMLAVTGLPPTADSTSVTADASIFGVITHKGGFAAVLAHDHLVVAGDYDLDLRFDETSPLATSLELTVAADELVVDDPDLRRLWYPRIEELSILDRPFGELSKKNRAKIRKAMLGDRQLAAGRYPTIRARFQDVKSRATASEERDFPYVVDLSLSLRDTTVTAPCVARYEIRDGTIRLEAYGTFRFTDFGIKPYSAMLGAVKNQDEFHVFASLEVRSGKGSLRSLRLPTSQP